MGRQDSVVIIACLGLRVGVYQRRSQLRQRVQQVVAHLGASQVVEINIHTGRVVRTISIDMTTWRVTGTIIVGVEPDVLAFDGHAGRLYVAAESGWVTVLQLYGHRLRVIYPNYLADDAHVVAVDPVTGRSYFPVLGASGGHPAVLVCEIT